MKRFTASPVCCPEWSLERACAFFKELGFSQIEIFTNWTAAQYRDGEDTPERFRKTCESYGIYIVSYHLPQIETGKPESFEAAVRHLKIAAGLGASIVLFKGDTIDTHIQHLPALLDAAQDLELQVVIQNHKNSCLQTLEDYDRVLDGVNDSRLQTVLEIGHFAAVGIQWKEAYEHLKGRFALVHLKDINAEGHPCPWGEGEVDFPALLELLENDGYQGTCVVEFEGAADERPEGLRQAVSYIQSITGKTIE